MNPEDLQEASYRGVPFFVSAITQAGGRKDVKKPFINSNLQSIEDLGLQQPDFSVTGTVAARRNNSGALIKSYQEARKEIIAALEKGGTGIFVHPIQGRIENVVCRSFTIAEDLTSLGDSPLTIQFGISNAVGVPIPEENVLGGVSSANDAVITSVGKLISEQFSVTAQFTGNFTDGIDKVDTLVEDVNESTSPVVIEEDKLDAFDSEVTKISDDAALLVNNPTNLSSSITSLFDTMSGLYTTPQATFDSFVGLFGYGDNDVPFPTNTPGRVERQGNREDLNASIQSLALSYAYLAAVQIDFPTTDDIDATSVVLEEQFQKVIAAGEVTSEVAENLTLLRIQASDFFKSQRVTRPQVLTVRTNPTSTRLLAFQYYGDSTLGASIIPRLNGLADSSVIEGDIQILSS